MLRSTTWIKMLNILWRNLQKLFEVSSMEFVDWPQPQQDAVIAVTRWNSGPAHDNDCIKTGSATVAIILIIT